jgi:hypothetical protein
LLKQSFNLLFLHIWCLFFLLLFVLFEVVYKIDFFLISSSFNFFVCNIWSPIFWLLFVLFELIFMISPSNFFSYQTWSSFFLLLIFFYIREFFKLISFFQFHHSTLNLLEFSFMIEPRSRIPWVVGLED